MPAYVGMVVSGDPSVSVIAQPTVVSDSFQTETYTSGERSACIKATKYHPHPHKGGYKDTLGRPEPRSFLRLRLLFKHESRRAALCRLGGLDLLDEQGDEV